MSRVGFWAPGFGTAVGSRALAFSPIPHPLYLEVPHAA